MMALRNHRKMSLLTEVEILGAGFLQRCRAYGATEYPEEIIGDKISEPLLSACCEFKDGNLWVCVILL